MCGSAEELSNRAEDDVPPGMTFASARDAARYRVLAVRADALEAELEAVQTEMNGVLYRATWSLRAIMDRDG